MEQDAIQDHFKGNYCWGCGTLNPVGLHLKSHWDGDETVCTWQPKPEFMAGPQHILYGGMIASLIDCHSVSMAIADAYRREGRSPDSDPLIWYVTGSLHAVYRKPTPLAAPVTLRARIREVSGRKTTVTCSVSSMGEERVRGEVIAVRVPLEWRAAG